MVGALAAAVSLAIAGTGFAQITQTEVRTTEVVVVPAPATTPPVVVARPVIAMGHVDGRVVDVAPVASDAKAVRLNTGDQVVVASSSFTAPPQINPGTQVHANYVTTNGTDKFVTTMRADEFQAP